MVHGEWEYGIVRADRVGGYEGGRWSAREAVAEGNHVMNKHMSHKGVLSSILKASHVTLNEYLQTFNKYQAFMSTRGSQTGYVNEQHVQWDGWI